MGGLLQSTLTCEACGKRSHCFEPFLHLALPVARGRAGQAATLQVCRGAGAHGRRVRGLRGQGGLARQQRVAADSGGAGGPSCYTAGAQGQGGGGEGVRVEGLEA